MFALSLPPIDRAWVAWVALAPLLVAAAGQRPLVAAGLGMLAGFTCGAVHVGWHTDTLRLHFAYLPFLWLAVLLGVVALAANVVGKQGGGGRWVLFTACAGVTTEWLMTFSPLPVTVAVSQHQTLPILQLAAVTGIWGVSFLVWFMNAAVADALRQRRWTPPLTVAGALAASHGLYVLSRPDQREQPLRVAAIQDFTGAETEGLVQPVLLAAGTPDQEALTRRAAAAGAQVLVWSEGSLGSAFNPETYHDPTTELARELRTHLVVGYTEPARPKAFNAAAIVAPDGSVRGVHRKIHPFLGERQTVQAGRAATAFSTSLGRIGVEICFDSCYPSVTRRIVRAGAQLIAMPNYDPPTPRAILHHLHGSLLPFRAVENRVPFVAADPNGLSQIIDRYGRVVAKSPLYVADALVADIARGDGKGTAFTLLGDWLAYLCLAGLLTLTAPGSWRRFSRPGRLAA